MKRTLIKTWQCTAFAFALEVALPDNPKNAPWRRNWMTTTADTQEICRNIRNSVFASLCNQRSRQIYKPRFARNAKYIQICFGYSCYELCHRFWLSTRWPLWTKQDNSILGMKLVVLQGKGTFHFALLLRGLRICSKLQLIEWLTFPLLVTSPSKVCVHLVSVFVLLNTRSVRQSIRWRN